MSLRAALAELIGAEIQQHTISIGGKSKAFHFRQISDEEGRVLFAAIEGEAAIERGRRISVQLVALSVCDDAGNRIGTEAESAELPAYARQLLFEKAALANNIALAPAAEEMPAEETDSAVSGADVAESPKA